MRKNAQVAAELTLSNLQQVCPSSRYQDIRSYCLFPVSIRLHLVTEA